MILDGGFVEMSMVLDARQPIIHRQQNAKGNAAGKLALAQSKEVTHAVNQARRLTQ